MRLASVASINEAVREVRSWLGDIDILVNNAGAYLMTPLGLTEEATVDQMLDVNCHLALLWLPPVWQEVSNLL